MAHKRGGFVQCPLDFFRRQVVIKMSRKWERFVELWFFILTLAKEARSDGLLIIDGIPLDCELLSELHRSDVEEAFFDDLLEFQWLSKDEDGILSVADHSNWYLPFEDEAERKKKARAKANSKPKATRPKKSGQNPENSAPVPDASADIQGIPRLSGLEEKRREEKPIHLENAACSVQSRESNENQGLEGVQSRPALMVAGVKTISSTANRLVSIVQQRFPTFIPKIQEADTLVRDMLDLCKRKSQWEDYFSEADFELGLELASRHAEALEHEGKGPHKLLAWIRELNTRKYLQAAHDWRKGNEKRHAKGKPPLPPPEPDLSELERRR